jgi:hypothetical protein
MGKGGIMALKDTWLKKTDKEKYEQRHDIENAGRVVREPEVVRRLASEQMEPSSGNED